MMQPDEMLNDLQQKEKKLKEQIIELEKIYDEKKAQYLKVLGAIEALENVDLSTP